MCSEYLPHKGNRSRMDKQATQKGGGTKGETENGELNKFFTLLSFKFLIVAKKQIPSINADSVISHQCP